MSMLLDIQFIDYHARKLSALGWAALVAGWIWNHGCCRWNSRLILASPKLEMPSVSCARGLPTVVQAFAISFCFHFVLQYNSCSGVPAAIPPGKRASHPEAGTLCRSWLPRRSSRLLLWCRCDQSGLVLLKPQCSTAVMASLHFCLVWSKSLVDKVCQEAVCCWCSFRQWVCDPFLFVCCLLILCAFSFYRQLPGSLLVWMSLQFDSRLLQAEGLGRSLASSGTAWFWAWRCTQLILGLCEPVAPIWQVAAAWFHPSWHIVVASLASSSMRRCLSALCSFFPPVTNLYQASYHSADYSTNLSTERMCIPLGSSSPSLASRPPFWIHWAICDTPSAPPSARSTCFHMTLPARGESEHHCASSLVLDYETYHLFQRALLPLINSGFHHTDFDFYFSHDSASSHYA